MTTLDDTIVPKALQLVDKYGLIASFDDYNRPSYNPTTGVGSDNIQQQPIDRKITPPMPYETNLIDHDLIRVGDARTYIATPDLGFTPRIGMTVTIGTEVWRTVGINEIRTGELIALFELQLRH